MTSAPDTIAPALFGLIAFFVLFAIAAWLLRRLQGRMQRSTDTDSGSVRVIVRRPLAWQCMLVVVEIGGKQYALAISKGGRVTVIDELAEGLTLAPPGRRSFKDLVDGAIRRRKGDRA